MELDYELIFGMDKQMHLVSYAVLSVILGMVIVIFSNKHAVKKENELLMDTLVTFGIFEEYRQYLLPNRSAELLDATANMIGVTIGLAIPMFISYVFRNRHHFISKRFAVYSLILITMFVGLLFLNERPFVTFDGPIQERLENIVALIGL
ncbi:VanZ family protein [Bacillus carboniphilus]|uniref:VanZ family protein n=1 Tax=Bacillus carboniphilus TaxID=86663 RepID=A0ABY9JQ82_9BACI|nr:VanZ family protein [Bacillus carboniphilus]WLR41557.1 VanZ family protein [Bacillus carboniphilus]